MALLAVEASGPRQRATRRALPLEGAAGQWFQAFESGRYGTLVAAGPDPIALQPARPSPHSVATRCSALAKQARDR
jgi:hypothetical protein